MNVFVNGILAAKTTSSKITGIDSKESARMFERAYRKLFPYAEIHSEAEWKPWLFAEEQEDE